MSGGTRLPNGWRLVRLGNVAEVLDARRVPLNSDERAKMPGKYPYYGANGIVDYIDQWIFDEVEDLILLAEDGGHFDEYRTRPIAYRVNGRCWVNNHAHVLKARDSGCGGFIFYSLAHKDVRPFIKGTTRSKLTQADLLQIEIGLPSDAREILAIAAVLDSIDAAIERTEEVIAATERLRDALLHKLLTRGVPGWHSEWKEAPGVGTIPACWHVVRLGDAADWANGLAFRDIQFSEIGKPVIRIAELKAGITTQTKFTKQSFDQSVYIHPGDLLFAWSGQPETSINAFWWNGPEGWLNQHIFRVTTRSQVNTTFFYYLLRHLNSVFVRIARGKQTAGLGHVTKEELFKMEAAFPPMREQQAIAEALDGVDEAIEHARQERDALQLLKASAADALLTGHVRISP